MNAIPGPAFRGVELDQSLKDNLGFNVVIEHLTARLQGMKEAPLLALRPEDDPAFALNAPAIIAFYDL